MVNIKLSLALFIQGLVVIAPVVSEKLDSLSDANVEAEATRFYAPSYKKVVITSPSTIKAGRDFTITWNSPKPDPKKKHTEVHVELWALNSGPVSSPQSVYKSGRLFDVTSHTHKFPAGFAGATTKGNPILWQLYVAVYSTYFDRNITDLEPWNFPYYGVQRVTFK